MLLAALIIAQATQANRDLLDVLDRLNREANFRNEEVNDGRRELNLQMPLRATAYPGVCSQDYVRIRDAGSPTMTLKDIETTTTYRVVSDPRPRPDAPGSAYFKGLDAQCRTFEIANSRAANALTAWAAAYAVVLARTELEKSSSDLLSFGCVDASDACGDRSNLLQFIKPDAIVRAALADCPAGRCVQVTGFYDAYAAKIRNKAVFVNLVAQFDKDGPGGVGAFKGARITEDLVDSDDD